MRPRLLRLQPAWMTLENVLVQGKPRREGYETGQKDHKGKPAPRMTLRRLALCPYKEGDERRYWWMKGFEQGWNKYVPAKKKKKAKAA